MTTEIQAATDAELEALEQFGDQADDGTLKLLARIRQEQAEVSQLADEKAIEQARQAELRQEVELVKRHRDCAERESSAAKSQLKRLGITLDLIDAYAPSAAPSGMPPEKRVDRLAKWVQAAVAIANREAAAAEGNKAEREALSAEVERLRGLLGHPAVAYVLRYAGDNAERMGLDDQPGWLERITAARDASAL